MLQNPGRIAVGRKSDIIICKCVKETVNYGGCIASVKLNECIKRVCGKIRGNRGTLRKTYPGATLYLISHMDRPGIRSGRPWLETSD